MALSTQVTRPGRPAALRSPASLKAKSNSRSQTARVMTWGVAGFAVVLDTSLAAGCEEALGRLPDQHEVETGRARVRQDRRRAGDTAHGPDPGVETELEAQVQLRGHLGSVGIAHVRQSHRGQQDGIGPAGGLQRFLRQCGSFAAVGAGAGGQGLERQLETAHSLSHRR